MIFSFLFLFDNVMEIVGRGSLINVTYPVRLTEPVQPGLFYKRLCDSLIDSFALFLQIFTPTSFIKPYVTCFLFFYG
jgi:hypothetical protein